MNGKLPSGTSQDDQDIPVTSRKLSKSHARMMNHINSRRAQEGNWNPVEWDWEERDLPPRQTNRSRGGNPKWRNNRERTSVQREEKKDNADAAIDFRSKFETAPSDEPLYDVGAYRTSVADHELFAQNFDIAGFPTYCEATFEVLRAIEGRLERKLPFSMFLHLMSTIHNCYLLDLSISNGRRPSFVSGSAQDILPSSLCIPDNIYHYIIYIGNTTTASGDDVRANIPLLPLGPVPAEQGPPALDYIPSGSFGRITAANHNAYECYISPIVTANRVLATRAQQRAWQPLPRGAYPNGGVPTLNLLGYGAIDDLSPEGRTRIKGFDFPDDDTLVGRP